MNGMKEGAGEDPFATDEDDEESDGTRDRGDRSPGEADAGETEAGGGDVDEADVDEADSGASTTGGSGDAASTGSGDAAGADSGDGDTARDDGVAAGRQGVVRIPYKFRRDGVQDGRDRVPLFLQDETRTAEREALREFEDRFGDDVSLTDLREALVMVGLEHLDGVERQLEAWGYGMTFEE